MSTAIEVVHGGKGEWRKPRRGDHFRTCSWCGSMHPEDLAAEVGPQGACKTCGLTGWAACFEGQQRLRGEGEMIASHSYDPGAPWAEWADWKYGWPHKLYINGLKPRKPGLLHCTSHYHGAEKPSGEGWVYAADLTRGQKRIIAESGMHASKDWSGWYQLGPKASVFGKFYSEHLADPAIGEEAHVKIAEACKLRFHFGPGGGVIWHSWKMPCSEHDESGMRVAGA